MSMSDPSEPQNTTKTTKKRSSKKDVTPSEERHGKDGCHACACSQDKTAVHTKLDKIIRSLEDLGSRVSGIEIKLQETMEKVANQPKEIEELRTTASFLSDKCKCKNITASVNSRFDGTHVDIYQVGKRWKTSKTKAAETTSSCMAYRKDQRETSNARNSCPISSQTT